MTRNNKLSKTAAVSAMTAAMLLSTFTAGAVENTTPAKPRSNIKLGSLFADNAVLQRQMKTPVWGWSKPGVKGS